VTVYCSFAATDEYVVVGCFAVCAGYLSPTIYKARFRDVSSFYHSALYSFDIDVK
jgi:hypothetical protein